MTTEAGGATAIVGGRALIGANLDVVDDSVVVLEGGVIAAAGSRSDTSVPDDAAIVDASGLVLLPGFIDAHVHIGFARPSEVMRRGVTTVRDLGWPPKKIWPLVEASRRTDFDGPEILAAGQMLTAPRGYPSRATWAPLRTALPVGSPVEAAEAVAAQADSGACIVKVALNPPVGPTLDGPTLAAIVEAAHDRDLRVTGHIYGLAELHKAIDAGVDELAHMLMSPEPIPSGTLARMAAQQMTVVPTLACFFAAAQDIAVDNLRAWLAAGGAVVYGTDLGNEGPRPGIDPREVEALTRAGLSTTAIIACATIDAARYLGLDDRGVLSVGRRADVIALRAAALDDASALTDVALVWRQGRRVGNS